MLEEDRGQGRRPRGGGRRHRESSGAPPPSGPFLEAPATRDERDEMGMEGGYGCTSEEAERM